jgi:membrane complex biogenesis BtpA family protein
MVSERSGVPSLIGVVHLRPLPGSPRYERDWGRIVGDAARDANMLAETGFDGVLVENFGDAPFMPQRVEPITVAAMTACALAVRAAASSVSLGVNVLRNDAEAAVAIAAVVGAEFVRVNVHTGARVTDQGVIEGRAHDTLRTRRALGATSVKLLCDVDVKHSAPFASRPLADESRDLAGRGLADAILVTGSATGHAASVADVDEVVLAVDVPVLVASGVTDGSVEVFRRAHGVIVGSWLRKSGRAGDPIDHERAKRLVDAYHAAKSDDRGGTSRVRGGGP